MTSVFEKNKNLILLILCLKKFEAKGLQIVDVLNRILLSLLFLKGMRGIGSGVRGR